MLYLHPLRKTKKVNSERRCTLLPALQLFLKAKILAKGIEFPKTHQIRKLLELLSKLENKPLDLSKEEEKILEMLEEAYISSRYLPFSFSEEDVNKALMFVKKLMSFYGKSL